MSCEEIVLMIGISITVGFVCYLFGYSKGADDGWKGCERKVEKLLDDKLKEKI